MRFIALLKPIELTEINGEPILNDGKPVTCSHAEFLLGRLADVEFSSDIDSIAIGLAIRAKLLKKGDKYLALEDAHWSKLVSSVKSPNPGNGARGYNPQLAHNFMSFIESVTGAPDKDPATKKAVER